MGSVDVYIDKPKHASPSTQGDARSVKRKRKNKRNKSRASRRKNRKRK